MMTAKFPWLNTKNLLVFAFSVFFALEMFGQQYNEHSWTFLMLLLVTINVIFLFKKKLFFPNTRLLYFLIFTFAVTALQSILNGAYLLEERWVTRYMATLTIFSILQIEAEEDMALLIAWPILGFVFIMSAWSLYQYIFEYTVVSKDALSTFGSRFWNISYYSQAMSLALPFLSYLKAKKDSKFFSYVTYLTSFIILITLFASQSRASLLGLFIFSIMEFFRPLGFKRKYLLLILIAGFVTNFEIWHYKTSQLQPVNVNKAESLSYHKNIMLAALKMGKDFPTGVGTDRFKSFLDFYYDSKKPYGGIYTNIVKSPHCEPLQVLAEEGWAVFAIYAVTILTFLSISIKMFLDKNEQVIFPKFFLCLLPQILTHFPFDLYFPVLLFAIAVTPIIKKKPLQPVFSTVSKILFFSVTILICLIYVLRQYGFPSSKYAGQYCEIFHDNFEICSVYFLKNYDKQDFSEADQINRPLIKYQPFFHGSLIMDYTLGVEPRSQIAACLYYNLYNGEHSINGSNVKSCALVPDRQKKLELFNEYAEKR